MCLNIFRKSVYTVHVPVLRKLSPHFGPRILKLITRWPNCLVSLETPDLQFPIYMLQDVPLYSITHQV
jgi:hypothetical protein